MEIQTVSPLQTFFQQQEKIERALLLTGIIVLLSILIIDLAVAGGAGGGNNDPFNPVWTTIKNWTKGTLGRVICGAMVLVGIIAGVVRQSIMAFAVGIGAGVGLYNMPAIIESVFGATLDTAIEIGNLGQQLSNGLF